MSLTHLSSISVRLRGAGPALIVAAVTAVSRPGAAQTPAAAASSVIDSIQTVATPERSFMPKYRPEWLLGVGYSGTVASIKRQWPSLVLSPEVLFARPGQVDIGTYLEFRAGRPDANDGWFEVGVGFELMWRVLEKAEADLAPMLRGTYLLDAAHPDNPLVRPGIGFQISLVRWLAVQATYDTLFSIDRAFTDDRHFRPGFSLTLKLGLCPMLDTCHQVRVREIETVDRSGVACNDAAAVCLSAKAAPGNASNELCSAAARAMDPSRHPADWGDPTGAFLDALKRESSPELAAAIATSWRALRDDHAASIQGIDAYAERLRRLGPKLTLSARYSYLVTPTMIRDWLGCDVNGNPAPCPTEAICTSDTGVTTNRAASPSQHP
jgi:hypothetical protein